MKRLLTVEEAADYAGFSVRYLRRLVFERRIAFHKDRRRIWFAPDDLDAYIRGLRVEPVDTQAPSRGTILAVAPARRPR
ncbi:MAG: helix-turn-helix domain-containing protein [Actinomycetota bacterium]